MLNQRAAHFENVPEQHIIKQTKISVYESQLVHKMHEEKSKSVHSLWFICSE